MKRNARINRKKYRTSPELMVRSLGFTEKFTILRKVIANRFNNAMPVKNIGITLLLIAITLLNSSSTFIGEDYKREGYKIDMVIIDAGHGGKDPGTQGKNSKEKDICLKIALKLGKYIEQNLKDVEVVYTRKTDTYLAWMSK
jgi:N-acetylmuramoyl-L-alanine amidase